MSPRTVRELRTLAAALDSLISGKPPELGYLLVQRFKALEQAVRDKDWTLASQIELTDSHGGLVTPEERQAAARQALVHLKFRDLREKHARDRSGSS